MVFCFVQNFFFGQHKSQNIIFFVAQSAIFFLQNLTLGYMTKTLNQIFFFSSTKIRIFFSATVGIRIFFQKKTITPPLQVKWLFPQGLCIYCNSQQHLSLIILCVKHFFKYDFNMTYNVGSLVTLHYFCNFTLISLYRTNGIHNIIILIMPTKTSLSDYLFTSPYLGLRNRIRSKNCVTCC